MKEEFAIQRMRDRIEEFALLPESIWPLTYQDGVRTTLEWILSEGRDPLAPMDSEIAPRIIDLRHRLPGGWREDFAALKELEAPHGRSGWPTGQIPWLSSFLQDTVPFILAGMFSIPALYVDDRIGQHILLVDSVCDEWFPWHTHGFEDSFLSFVLFPFDRDEGTGGSLELATGESFVPRAGHAAIFDGRATAHCVRETKVDTEKRFSITAFYRSTPP